MEKIGIESDKQFKCLKDEIKVLIEMSKIQQGAIQGKTDCIEKLPPCVAVSDVRRFKVKGGLNHRHILIILLCYDYGLNLLMNPLPNN